MQKIQKGDQISPEWKQGAIAHIYKDKGSINECKNYRPICLTQIAYKIWSILITTRISKIPHLITGINQLGYKHGLSTLGAIQKLEEYIRESKKGSQILTMDLSKAFDAINRTLLWTALYKKGIPLENTTQIRQGHKQTMLCAKHQGKYGKAQENNVGVFQGSAISALLFIIYLDDMMEDCQSLNHQNELPTRMTIQRTPDAGTTHLVEQLQRKTLSACELKSYLAKRTRQQQWESEENDIYKQPPPDTEYIIKTPQQHKRHQEYEPRATQEIDTSPEEISPTKQNQNRNQNQQHKHRDTSNKQQTNVHTETGTQKTQKTQKTQQTQKTQKTCTETKNQPTGNESPDLAWEKGKTTTKQQKKTKKSTETNKQQKKTRHANQKHSKNQTNLRTNNKSKASPNKTTRRRNNNIRRLYQPSTPE